MSDSITITRTVYFRCRLPRQMANAFNAESGRIYTQVKIEHYRVYAQTGHWLSQYDAMRLNDFYNHDRPALLHAHSIDAAQEGFYKACRTAKANREDGAKYPRHNKPYRTTIWKKSGIRRRDDRLLLSLARGLDPIRVALPDYLHDLPDDAFTEMKLVYNPASHHHEWHLVITVDVPQSESLGTNVAAADLGEVHPAALTDGEEAVVISCRQLRAQKQHTAKNLASLQHKQSHHKKGSRRYRRLQHRKNRFLAKQKRRRRDIEHKISREVIDWCEENNVGKLYIGDVRDVADGKRLHRKSQQKIGAWSHGKLRKYINYKATAAGIEVNDKIPEHYTSQTCPECRNRYKPQGRVYTCPVCGFCAHRDVVGASNILSRAVYGELGKVRPPETVKYRHPVLRGKRSSPGHGASSSVSPA
ncbi:MAG: transposase [Chloroflexi bacterium]|nr:transposase [Chloroflexota bacterium]